jgi:hypothetical protein
MLLEDSNINNLEFKSTRMNIHGLVFLLALCNYDSIDLVIYRHHCRIQAKVHMSKYGSHVNSSLYPRC